MKGTMAEYLKSVGWFGTLEVVHEIGDYAIIEYTEKKGGEVGFAVYGTSHLFHSLDSALLFAIGAKHLNVDHATRFEMFACRMLGIKSVMD